MRSDAIEHRPNARADAGMERRAVRAHVRARKMDREADPDPPRADGARAWKSRSHGARDAELRGAGVRSGSLDGNRVGWVRWVAWVERHRRSRRAGGGQRDESGAVCVAVLR